MGGKSRFALLALVPPRTRIQTLAIRQWKLEDGLILFERRTRTKGLSSVLVSGVGLSRLGMLRLTTDSLTSIEASSPPFIMFCLVVDVNCGFINTGNFFKHGN